MVWERRDLDVLYRGLGNWNGWPASEATIVADWAIEAPALNSAAPAWRPERVLVPGRICRERKLKPLRMSVAAPSNSDNWNLKMYF